MIELAEVRELLGEEVSDEPVHVEFTRRSKHRGGRTPKRTANQKRLFTKRERARQRLRMTHAMDATALRRALESGQVTIDES